MVQKRTPVSPKAPLALSDEPTLSDIATYSTPIRLNADPTRRPFSLLWQEFGITIQGNSLQALSGYDQSTYTKTRRGERRISPSYLFAACLLSRISVQQACDVFHLCESTHDLPYYRYDASVLVYLLDDMKIRHKWHGYGEFVWLTLKLRYEDGLYELPPMHRNQRQWKEMKRAIDEDDITLDEVRKQQEALFIGYGGTLSLP